MPEPGSILRSLLRQLGTGLGAGALAGIAVGGVEAIVLNLSDPALDDRAILWWAPLFYGLCFAPVGAASGLACQLYLERRGSPHPEEGARRFALAAALFAGAVTALRWRVHRDVAWLAEDYGRRPVDAGILVAALALAGLGFWVAGRARPRSQWLTAGVFVLAGAALSNLPVDHGRSLPPSVAAPAKGPNVILIALDTLRADYLKLYDPEAPTDTPAIERYARDAVLFENAVAQGSWTKASFGAIYTGLHPREHTAIDNAHALPDEVLTLAEALRDAGYTTLGMSNCNPNNSMAMGFGQGFGYFEDIRNRGFRLGYPASARRLILFRRLLAPALERFLPFDLYTEHYYQRADRIAAKGLDWIDTRTSRERPFFLVLHFMDPHDPYMDGQLEGRGYLHQYLMRVDRTPFVADFVDAYAGDIDFMDPYVGVFLDGLRARGLYDDALIVLTSDHGEEFAEHGGFSHGQSVYDELIRVALVVKLPGNRAAGERNSHLARHIDVAPTVLSLAGIEVPDSMRGEPLIEADGEFRNADIHVAFSEANLFDLELVSVRGDREKLIRDGSYGGQETVLELYDLARDPGEQHDRSDEDPGAVSALSRLIDAFLAATSDRPAPELGDLSPAEKEQLEALGYLE